MTDPSPSSATTSSSSKAAQALSSSWKVIPGLKCRDPVATAKFYTKLLHFSLGGINPEPSSSSSAAAAAGAEQKPTMCSIYSGDKAVVNIYHFLVGDDDEDKFVPGWVLIAMGTEELDVYYDELRREGQVKIVEEIGDREWGYRQFSVVDGDGNKLTFFRFLEGGNPGTG